MNIFFDIEVFKNLFLVCLKRGNKVYHFKNLKTLKEDLAQVIKKDDILVGFNIIHFDLPMLIFALEGTYDELQLHEICQSIINDKSSREYEKNEDGYYNLNEKGLRIRKAGFITKRFGKSVYKVIEEKILSVYGNKYQDLKPFLLNIGLKTYMARMHFEDFITFTYDVDQILSTEEIQNVIKYCVNDIKATEFLYNQKEDCIKMRNIIKEEYGVDVTHRADSSIGEGIIRRLFPYLRPRPFTEDAPILFFRDDRYYKILNENIPKEFKDVLSYLLTSEQINDFIQSKKKTTIEINKGHYTLAKGGLHSTHDVYKIYKSNEDFRLIEIDVTSFYPNIIIGYQINDDELKRALDILETKNGILEPGIINFLKDRFKKRLVYKKEGNIQKANIEKLMMNSIFGKFLYKDGCIYDPSSAYSVTLSGQIWLLYLIFKLEESGFEVLSANTDGLLVKVGTEDLSKYERVTKEWENYSKFNLERNDVENIYIRDVNAYFVCYMDKTKKHKGIFTEIREAGGSEPNIISKLAELKLMDPSLDINEEVKKYNDIRDYLYIKSCKKGGVITWKGENYGKIVRFVKSFEDVPLIKSENGNKIPNSNYAYPIVHLEGNMDNVNKDLYVEEALKIYNMFDIETLIEIVKNEKRPTTPGWQNIKVSQKIRKGYNVARLIKPLELVLDIDVKVDPDAIKKSEHILEMLKVPYFYNVETPSGGRHIYFKLAEEINMSKYSNTYGSGVEFKYTGSIVLVPPSVINGKHYIRVSDYKQKLNKTQCRKIGKLFSKPKKGDKKEIIDENTYENLSYTKIKNRINKINADDLKYHEWLYVGFALHDYFNGSKKGLKLFDTWSKTSSEKTREAGKVGKYEEGECEYLYNTKFKEDKEEKVKIGTLFYYIEKYKESEYLLPEPEKDMSGSTEQVLEVAKKIEDPIEKGVKNNEICESYEEYEEEKEEEREAYKESEHKIECEKEKGGKSIKIQEEKEPKKHNKKVRLPKDKVLKDWVYYDEISKFVNVKDGSELKKDGFNRDISYLLEVNKNRTKKGIINATTYSDNHDRIPVVRDMLYNPLKDDTLYYNYKGQLVLNTFDKKTLMKSSKDYTKEGLDFIKIFKYHLDLLSNNEGQMILNYISHILQKRGKKIGWFILLISELPGVGKSFLIELLFNILGKDSNARLLTADDFDASFKDWMDAKLCILCTEFYTKKYNKEEILISMKNIITDKNVKVHEKFKNKRRIDSFCNGMLACNDTKDIGKLSNDRRWYIVDPFIYTKKDLAITIIDLLGEDLKIIGIEEKINKKSKDFQDKVRSKYYNYIWDNVEKFTPQIIKMLEEREIDESFLKQKEAPMSEAKKILINNQKEDIDGLLELEELIDSNKNNHLYNEDYITKFIWDDLLSQYSISISNHNKSKLRNMLGYKIKGARAEVKEGDSTRYNTFFRRNILVPKQMEIIEKYKKEK